MQNDNNSGTPKKEKSTKSTTYSNRAQKQVMNERLAATMDKIKISDRDAVHFCIAVAEALGHDVSTLIINRNSIHRSRQQYREKIAKEVKNKFTLSKPGIIHWDGKLLPELTGKQKVERLPILITSLNTQQLLGVPSLPNGCGREIALAVFNKLFEWNLLDNVQAACFDTTSSNTGRLQGSVTLLEQKLERSLLYLPCRHHIFELVLKAVFEHKVSQTSAPVVLLFKRFQENWGNTFGHITYILLLINSFF